jgi:hypothetical protein
MECPNNYCNHKELVSKQHKEFFRKKIHQVNWKINFKKETQN